MDKSELSQKNINDIHQSIGEFIVAFEMLCHHLKLGVTLLLQSQGLKNGNVAEILLSDLTAKPLSDLYRSLFAEIYKPDTDEEAILKKVFNDVRELIEARNNIIHSTWFVGWGTIGSENDFSKVDGYKQNRNKTGRASKSWSYTKEDFEEHRNEATRLQKIIQRLSVCDSKYRIKANFHFNENKIVIPQPPKD